MENKSIETIQPESYLSEFNRLVKRLYLNSLVFEDKSLESEIINLLKKLIASEILSKKYYMAISGLQGVGKSTLIKNFYDLPENIIPETRSIGEKLPIIITEWDEIFYGFRAKVIVNEENEIRFEERIIEDSNTFLEISRNPGVEYVMLELLVPRKYFMHNSISFVLLPGIEQNRDSWNDLVKHILYSSSNCILVFNEQRLNDCKSTNLMNDIKEEFGDAKPIIALTFGDQSEDENETLKDEFIKNFNIPSNEEDRVIRTSINDLEIERWTGELKRALEKYSHVERDFRFKQVELLDKLISENFNSIISKMESYNSMIDMIDESESSRAVKRILRGTQKKNEEIKKIYFKFLKRELDEIANKACNEIKNNVIDDGFFTKLKKQIFSTSLKDMDKFNNIILSSWKNACGNELILIPNSGIREAIFNSYSRFSNLNIQNNDTLNEVAVTTTERRNVTRVKAKENRLKREQEKLEVAINDISTLFKARTDGDLSKHINESIEYIPLMVLEIMYALSNVNSEGKNLNISDSYIEVNGEKINIINVLGESVEKQRCILNGIAAILGMDAIDGTGNIISALFDAIGIEVSAATSVALTSLLGVGIVGINLLGKLNKADIREYQQGAAVIDSIKNETYSEMRDNFNNLFDKVYEMIEKNLENGYGINERKSRYFRCQKNIAEAKSFSLEFRENINGYKCYLA